MIDLENRYLQMVQAILKALVPGCEVRLFGSRARGTARRYSDIDLAVVGNGPVSDEIIASLLQAFSESDLPYRVDVVDWQALPPGLREMIEQQGFEVLQIKK